VAPTQEFIISSRISQHKESIKMAGDEKQVSLEAKGFGTTLNDSLQRSIPLYTNSKLFDYIPWCQTD
jgi:hypothetical protein